MVKIAGYLEQRRAGYEAVVDVPPSLRAAVGRNRLRKGLGTRDVHVARARLPKAALELHARIDVAMRRSPATDPVTAEAMALREYRAGLAAGTVHPDAAPRWVTTADGDVVEIPAADVQIAHVDDAIETRAEAIAQAEGDTRARAFMDLASGRITPLALHVETWLAEPGQRGGRRLRTVVDYRSIVAGLGAWLTGQGDAAAVERVTRRMAGRYVTALHGKALSGPRIRTVISGLAGYWTWLERKGLIPDDGKNPWAGQAPNKPKGGAAHERERPFTDAEAVALLEGAPDTLMGDLMRLAALTGMRIEEACSLTVGMCQGGVFVVPGTKTDAARGRPVPIHSDLATMIARRCKDQDPAAYLFPELGKPDRFHQRSMGISKRFGRYRETVGVHDRAEGRRRSQVNFHSWRRWFITKALRAGQPERVVEQIVGHKLQGMTAGVYFGGDTLDAKRECVEAVKLPPHKAPRPSPSASSATLRPHPNGRPNAPSAAP